MPDQQVSDAHTLRVYVRDRVDEVASEGVDAGAAVLRAMQSKRAMTEVVAALRNLDLPESEIGHFVRLEEADGAYEAAARARVRAVEVQQQATDQIVAVADRHLAAQEAGAVGRLYNPGLPLGGPTGNTPEPWKPIPRQLLDAQPDLRCPHCGGDLIGYEPDEESCEACKRTFAYATPTPRLCPSCGLDLHDAGYPHAHFEPGTQRLCGYIHVHTTTLVPVSDEPIRPPNGGADQGLMHFDSALGMLWNRLDDHGRRLQVDGRALGNVITDLGEGITLGHHDSGHALAELRRIRAQIPDGTAAAQHIDTAIERLAAPDRPTPRLPEDAPPEAHALMDDLSRIDLVRRGGDVSDGGARFHETDQLADLMHRWSRRELTAGEFERALRRLGQQRHESSEGFTEIRQAVTKALSGRRWWRR